ncbi:biotin-dependent carboxylase-like uncharacterized protein [Mumia flava]|uniref:Biotin-dependent carboxylase-like uncharacterized protein n=1 Tax=Mumia flava TaxID=1348852 RepID=A0A0B2BKW1_9ACTN|nr:biotin-dependent carboxyltransferase family protein [Mumia flava]PJJ56424.1 biotin-dependent carboxylase-like uncharacterized protein [Mumia flava]
MSFALEVLAVRGPVLVTDPGRPGLASIGVGPSGPADRGAYAAANRLLGNDPSAPALEVTMGGLVVRADRGLWIAVCGAEGDVVVDGTEHPVGIALPVRDGSTVEIATPRRGARSYLAVRGGLDVAPVLGSAAYDTLGEVGPRPLRAGDRLAVGPGGAPLPGVDSPVPPHVPTEPVVLRVVRGPRDDALEDPEALIGTRWTVAPDSDRVGVRLDGPPLAAAGERVGSGESEGVLRGAVQLPPSGLPVVFGVDHPVTGGYPVVAVVVDADADVLGQLRPGEQVRLAWA